MDRSRHALAPSHPLSPMPRQRKVMLQRKYRANEGECIITLREVIKELTGKELLTRQEILRKGM
ncbi:hypothetical protein J3R83DRAFT_14064 [Lanmaoa asiatica]|nr:hypothetical protein J3R83DRAFT_14064 [Lanmaoa asiatica]